MLNSTVSKRKKKREYGKFNETKDEHGPEAAEVRVGKIAAEEGEEKDGPNKVSD